MEKLILANVSIKMDKEGRARLNDVHKALIASGVTIDCRPNKWLALDKTVRLIEMFKGRSPAFEPIALKRGHYGGTWAVPELLADYIATYSADFGLALSRSAWYGQQPELPALPAPDVGGLVPIGQSSNLVDLNDPRAMRSALLLQIEREAIKDQQIAEMSRAVEELTPKADGYDQLVNKAGSSSIKDCARYMDPPMRLTAMKAVLVANKIMYARIGNGYMAGTAQAILDGIVVYKIGGQPRIADSFINRLRELAKRYLMDKAAELVLMTGQKKLDLRLRDAVRAPDGTLQ